MAWNQPVTIASIVEGEGEVKAVPKLLYRLAREFSVPDLRVPEPMRVPRGRLVAAGQLERAVSAAAGRIDKAGGILVVLDADDDCPAQLGPALLARAQSARSDLAMAVVLANREFESWFLAAAVSLAGKHGFPEDLTPPGDPEGIRAAKEWLSRNRQSGRPYKPTADQALLTSVFDLKQARAHAPSFDKFCRDIEALFGSAYR